MKLYIVSVKEFDYDEYDSHVVAAHDEIAAQAIGIERLSKRCPPEIEYIGEAAEGTGEGIIHSSYNAG